jgi:hypothetical protein
MKKVVDLLVKTKTPKNLYGKEEKTCSLDNDYDEVLPSLEQPLLKSPHKKEQPVIPNML